MIEFIESKFECDFGVYSNLLQHEFWDLTKNVKLEQ